MARNKTFLKAALENLTEAGQTETDEVTRAAAAAGAGGEGTGETTPVEPAPVLAEEDLAVVAEEQDAEVEAGAEAEVAEVAIEELEDELDTASDDTVRVAEVAESLETSAENGGLPPEAAQAVDTAMEGLLEKYDMSTTHVMPALESFSDVKSRPAQTKFAAENFKEQAKQLGGKVMDGIRALIKWLQELFAKYLTQAGRLEARAKKLKEVAGKAGAAKEQEISHGGFLSRAKALAINGKLPENVPGAIDDVVQRAFKSAALASEIGRILENAAKVAGDASKEAKEGAANAAKEQAAKSYATFFEKSGEAAGASKNNVATVKSAGFDLPGNGLVLTTEVLPGNKVIWGSRDEQNVGLSRFGVASVAQKFDAQKVKTLSVEDIKKICDSAVQAASLKKVIGDIESKITKMSKSVGTTTFKESEGFKESFKTAVWVIREGISLAGAFHRPAVALAFATSSAGLDLAQASLKVYGVATPEGGDGAKKEGEGEKK